MKKIFAIIIIVTGFISCTKERIDEAPLKKETKVLYWRVDAEEKSGIIYSSSIAVTKTTKP
jgi:hypothetical protein